jgi:hypothetical protein
MSGSKETYAVNEDRTTYGRRAAQRILLACLSVAGAASSAAAARPDPIIPPPMPANLEVPEGNRPFLMVHAYGTQNYICLVAGQPWAFIGPQATLFNDARQTLTHFLSINPIDDGAAATWQHSRDSSAIWARAVESSTDPDYVQPGAVAWLKLRVVGALAGPTGGVKISRTTFVQRVNTVGGSAPSDTCPAVGARAFVPYETDYIFYKAE